MDTTPKIESITLDGRPIEVGKYNIDYVGKIFRRDLNNVYYKLGYLNGWNLIIGSNCNIEVGKSCNIEGGRCNNITADVDTMVYVRDRCNLEVGSLSMIYVGNKSEVKSGMGGIYYLGKDCTLDIIQDYKKNSL